MSDSESELIQKQPQMDYFKPSEQGRTFQEMPRNLVDEYEEFQKQEKERLRLERKAIYDAQDTQVKKVKEPFVPKDTRRKVEEFPVWNPANDKEFLTMADEMLDPNYEELAKHFDTHVAIVKKRYTHLNQPFIFTMDDEEKLIALVTEAYDKNEEPEWAQIGQQIRNKPGKECRKQYFKVMAQFWNAENTALLMKLVKSYKDKDVKPDWKKISEQLDGRPVKVLQDHYSTEFEKMKKIQ
ncbi:Homeobox-like_domain superfamily [Hexamita inflata]|uniref:Homeobox-like domain superfamily n=1 Tax=Hexamita inflata TaxID=28002 RepID=A0AA86VMQ2_9EUKA|nr:Homeobox-like domain superfamily [Hexamita inflata]